MVAKIRSLGLQGIGGYEVSAEIFLSGGLPQFDLVGLPDAAVKESKDRVRAALTNSNFFSGFLAYKINHNSSCESSHNI